MNCSPSLASRKRPRVRTTTTASATNALGAAEPQDPPTKKVIESERRRQHYSVEYPVELYPYEAGGLSPASGGELGSKGVRGVDVKGSERSFQQAQAGQPGEPIDSAVDAASGGQTVVAVHEVLGQMLGF